MHTPPEREQNASMTRLEREQREEQEEEEMQQREEDRLRAQDPPDPRTETMMKAATMEMNRIMAEAMDGQQEMKARRQL